MEPVKKGDMVTFTWAIQKDTPMELIGVVKDVWAGDHIIIEVTDAEGRGHNFHVGQKDIVKKH